MNTIDIVLPRLQVDEGYRAHVYKDTRGNDTIGYGFCIEAGISKYCAQALLAAQASELHAQLCAYDWYKALDEVRQSVPLEIAFNAGLHGLLGYPHMIAALEHQDWLVASKECTSNAPELKGRYDKLSKILLTGEGA